MVMGCGLCSGQQAAAIIAGSVRIPSPGTRTGEFSLTGKPGKRFLNSWRKIIRRELRSAVEIRSRYPKKTIWLYTGYLWEEIREWEIMKYLDVLVDGRFEPEKKDLTLKWKGSYNQRVINVPKSLELGQVVLHA